MTTLDSIFTRIAGLIEAADKGEMGDYFLEIPSAEWTEAESSLLRSAAVRKWCPRHFVWRGVAVVKGNKWGVEAV